MFAKIGASLSAFILILTVASGDGSQLQAGTKAGLKSGPTVGSTVPSFLTVNVTGPWEGQRMSLVEAYGQQPVALIFTRKLDEPVTALVKKLDAMAGGKKLRTVAVFLTKDDDVEARLTKLAETEKLNNSVLGVDAPAGPSDFGLSPDAEVTVILYSRMKVRASFAFHKAGLEPGAIKRVTEAAKSMVPR